MSVVPRKITPTRSGVPLFKLTRLARCIRAVTPASVSRLKLRPSVLRTVEYRYAAAPLYMLPTNKSCKGVFPTPPISTAATRLGPSDGMKTATGSPAALGLDASRRLTRLASGPVTASASCVAASNRPTDTPVTFCTPLARVSAHV